MSGKKEQVQSSLVTEFNESIWKKFLSAIKKYRLINKGDRIAVCISGGKDSMLMAALFARLKKYNIYDFDVTYVVMDPGYNSENRQLILQNAEMLEIPVKIFDVNIFNYVFKVNNNPCFLCAKIRRGHLYNEAKNLGCNKIALGHHYDDVIETILMGVLYSGCFQTMMPMLKSDNYEGMTLIRPMYLIREKDVENWRDYNDLIFLQCACRFTESCTDGSVSEESKSKRKEIKKLIAELKRNNPDVEKCIFASVANVDLRRLISYKNKGEKHSFLDEFLYSCNT